MCYLNAQQPNSQSSAVVVPRLVYYSGKAVDEQGKTITGIAGATFAIYKTQEGGNALWVETQNVTADKAGHYTVQLGAGNSEGLPLDLFASAEARWLGVSINGRSERTRTLLLSVPYALKAADAETLGGKPASAFMASDGSGTHGDQEKATSATEVPDLNGSQPPYTILACYNPTITGAAATTPPCGFNYLEIEPGWFNTIPFDADVIVY